MENIINQTSFEAHRCQEDLTFENVDPNVYSFDFRQNIDYDRLAQESTWKINARAKEKKQMEAQARSLIKTTMHNFIKHKITIREKTQKEIES